MDSSFTIRENSYNLWNQHQKEERTINKVYQNLQIANSNYVHQNGSKIPVIHSKHPSPINHTHIQKVINDSDQGFYRVIYKFSTGLNDGITLTPDDIIITPKQVILRESKKVDTGTIMNSSQIDSA